MLKHKLGYNNWRMMKLYSIPPLSPSPTSCLLFHHDYYSSFFEQSSFYSIKSLLLRLFLVFKHFSMSFPCFHEKILNKIGLSGGCIMAPTFRCCLMALNTSTCGTTEKFKKEVNFQGTSKPYNRLIPLKAAFKPYLAKN